MSPQNVLELAKQGNTNAIAALINQTLQQRGITAKVSKNNSCLRIMLESSEIPNQTSLVKFVSNGIKKLEVTGIDTLQVFGRQVGDDVPAWSQTIILGSTQSSLSYEQKQVSKPAPSKVIEEHAKEIDEDATNFKVKHNGQEFVTSSIEQLESWINEGQVSLTDYVYNPILKKWMYLRELAEIESIVHQSESSQQTHKQNQKIFTSFGLSYWEGWNYGGRIIFIASCIALASMFMSWVDVGIIKRNGFEQQTFLLLVFWIYPVFMLFRNKAINRIFGIFCSIGSFILTIAYVNSKSVELFDRQVNAAATGAWIFVFASVALGFGIIKYIPIGSHDVQKETIDISKLGTKLVKSVTSLKGKIPKSRITTGILAILLGSFGFHFFYLDVWGWGLVSILLCWTYIPAIAGVVVGIRCLLMSDKAFERKIKNIKGLFGPIEF